MGAFMGYAGYYLVRKNLSLAAPDMISQGLIDKGKVGIAMSAVSIAYAFSKFIMGTVSDRSDARKFLCVHSEEQPLPNLGEALQDGSQTFRKVQTNGSLAHITAIFGMTLAGLVVQDICKTTRE